VVPDKMRLKQAEGRLIKAWSGVAMLFVALSAAGCATPSGTQGAPGFGNVSLTSWQMRDVSIGPRYRNLRVCNDSASNGPVVVTIRYGWSRTLNPGACLKDRGNSFLVENQGGSSVRVTYGVY